MSRLIVILVFIFIYLESSCAYGYDPTKRPDNLNEGYQEQSALNDIKVDMVLVGGKHDIVVIGGKEYIVGMLVKRYRLLKIEPNKLEFSSGKENHVLKVEPQIITNVRNIK